MNALRVPTFASSPTTRSAPIDRILLAQLRFVACTCRAGARVNPSCDCTAPGAGMKQCLGALVAIAPHATGRHLTFYRPGEAEVSFDESWVLALVEAAARGDGDSLRFLVIRHVARASRARIALLARRIAEARASGIAGETDGTATPVPGRTGTVLK